MARRLGLTQICRLKPGTTASLQFVAGSSMAHIPCLLLRIARLPTEFSSSCAKAVDKGRAKINISVRLSLSSLVLQSLQKLKVLVPAQRGKNLRPVFGKVKFARHVAAMQPSAAPRNFCLTFPTDFRSRRRRREKVPRGAYTTRPSSRKKTPSIQEWGNKLRIH